MMAAFRAYYVFDAKEVVVERTPWKNLKSVAMIVSAREVNGKGASEVRYDISSRKTTAKLFRQQSAIIGAWRTDYIGCWM